jgi:hypothetical protein
MSEGNHTAIERLNAMAAAMSPGECTALREVLVATQKRVTRPVTADAFLQTQAMADYRKTFDPLSPDQQTEALLVFPPPKPKAKAQAAGVRRGARMKDAIRQAKRETPHPNHQLEIAEGADRLLNEWGINFKDECPLKWRHRKSLAQAFNDPRLKNRVKRLISGVQVVTLLRN